MPPLGKEMSKNRVEKEVSFSWKSCVWSWSTSSLLAPGQGYHLQWHHRDGRSPKPHLCQSLGGAVGVVGVEGDEMLAHSLESSFPVWSPAADLHVSRTRSRGREHAAEPAPTPFGPCSIQIWKKGLIVFNNMLSNTPYTPHYHQHHPPLLD